MVTQIKVYSHIKIQFGKMNINDSQQIYETTFNYIIFAIQKFTQQSDSKILDYGEHITNEFYKYPSSEIDISFLQELVFAVIYQRNYFAAIQISQDFQVPTIEVQSFLGVESESISADVIGQKSEEMIASEIASFITQHQGYEGGKITSRIFETLGDSDVIQSAVDEIQRRIDNELLKYQGDVLKKFYMKKQLQRNIYHCLPQMDYYHDKLCDYINKLRIQPEIPDMGMVCDSCGSRRIQSLGSSMMHAVDEAETTFLQCYDCGNNWRT